MPLTPPKHKPINFTDARLAKKLFRGLRRPYGSQCLEWQGLKTASNYGILHYSKAHFVTHRVAYAIHNQEDPGDLFVCHHCDNPPCCNPDHLFLGTSADNVRDMVNKGRAARQQGEAHGRARLTEQDIKKIRSEYKDPKLTAKKIASKYGINHWYVYDIVRGKRWHHV